MVFILSGLSNAIRAWCLLILTLGAWGALTFAFSLHQPYALLLVAATAGILLWISAHHSRSNLSTRTAIAFLLAIACVDAIWAFSFDSNQVSDFGVYYRCGHATAESLLNALEVCQSKFSSPNSTYWDRSLFYSSFISFFSTSYFAAKVANLLAHILSFLLIFYLTRKLWGNQTACVAAAVLNFFPEYWFTTTLLTTDNFAVAGIIVLIALLAEPWSSRSKGIFLAILIGLLAFLLDMLRSIGILVLLSQLFVVILNCSNSQSFRRVPMFLLTLLSYSIVKIAFAWSVPIGLPDLLSFSRLVTAIDFHTTQDFSVNHKWGSYFWPAIPTALQSEVAMYKLSTELANGFGAWPQYLLHKSAIAFTGSGYYGLASFPYPPGNPDSVNFANINAIPFLPSIRGWFGALMCVGCALAILGALRSKLSGLESGALAFVSAFGITVIGAGEIQSRYTVLLAPSMALLIAGGFRGLIVPPYSAVGSIRLSIRETLVGSGWLVLIFCVLLVGFKRLPNSKPLFDHTSLALEIDKNVGCVNSGISFEKSYKTFRVLFDSDSTCAVISLPAQSTGASLGGFLSSDSFPYLFEQRTLSPFSFSVDDGRTFEDIGERSVVWFKTPHDSRSELIIRRNTVGKKAYVDITLLKKFD